MKFFRKNYLIFSLVIIFFGLVVAVFNIYAASCTPGTPMSCLRNEGECTGLQEQCPSSGQFVDCSMATYYSRPFFEFIEFSSSDGKDNDCDGLTDGFDPDCQCVPSASHPCPLQSGVCIGSRVNRLADGTYPACNNEVYTNHSAYFEFDSVSNNPKELTCDDGFDNDCDGLVDCNDTTDCLGASNCVQEICNISGDEDGNGFADCADFTCAGKLGPGGITCCWEGPTPGHGNDNYCNPCQRCQPTKQCGAQPNSQEGNHCEGECTYCFGGSCINRTPNPAGAGDTDFGLEAECSQACQACADGAGGVCVNAHESVADDLGPFQCLAPDICQSGSCVTVTPINQCNNSSDDDGDGRVDFPSDPGCSSASDSSELNLAIECDDNIDNDSDSRVDLADIGCTSLTDIDESNCGDGVCEGSETSASCATDCGAVTACNNGLDDDSDGQIDYPADPGCSNSNDNSELNSAIECDDGLDNDGDGQRDLADSGCADSIDTDESNCGDGACEGGETPLSCASDCGAATACNNGLDDDSDGQTDFPADPGCSSGSDTSELNPAVQCDDGTDNDGDSQRDLADSGCTNLTDNDESNCGDGACEGGETCDTASCPADCGCGTELCCSGVCQPPACDATGDCNDSNSCTIDSCSNPSQCNAVCSYTTITTCTNSDSCCPVSCNALTDNDCSPVCGNGVCETPSETPTNCSLDCGQCVAGVDTRPCSLTQGVCSGARETCADIGGGRGAWQGCTTTTYTSWATAHGNVYEVGTELTCNDSDNNDCDTSTDCADSDCTGKSGPGGFTCCLNAGHCTAYGGDCLYRDCDVGDTYTCRYCDRTSPTCLDGSTNPAYLANWCGACGQCTPSGNNYDCQTKTPDSCLTSTECGVCKGSGSNPVVYQCGVPVSPANDRCSAVCSECNPATLDCQYIYNNIDCNGSNQCCEVGYSCQGSTPNPPICATCDDADLDGVCDENDVCPYDPDNDDPAKGADGDGLCAVGCNSGVSRTGTKTNGWICRYNSSVTYDTCQGGASGAGNNCTSANSCLLVFGAEDYMNIYINGKMMTGNLFLPKYKICNGGGKDGKECDIDSDCLGGTCVDFAANPRAVPLTPTNSVNPSVTGAYFNVSNYLVSGMNVIALEAYDEEQTTPTVIRNRALRGAIANYNDTGLCTLMGGVNPVLRTYRLSATDPASPAYQSYMPLKCYVKDTGERCVGGSNEGNLCPNGASDCPGGTCVETSNPNYPPADAQGDDWKKISYDYSSWTYANSSCYQDTFPLCQSINANSSTLIDTRIYVSKYSQTTPAGTRMPWSIWGAHSRFVSPGPSYESSHIYCRFEYNR
ncbi:MAG: hypothetical protein WC675_03040 [Patescibacteria group bacterium]|jgi:hypothetical protein